jgi:AcrR family transcriptional regulator
MIRKRRNQILNASIDVFGGRGLHGATMQAIASRAGMSVGLIYQYFEDKNELLLAVINDILDAYLREIPKAQNAETDPFNRFCAGVHAFCRVVDDHRAATLLGYRESRSLPRPQLDAVMKKELRATRLITQSILDCQRAGLMKGIDAEQLTYHLVVYVHSWALNTWRFETPVTRENYVERGLSLLIGHTLAEDGTATPRGTRRRDITGV